MKVMYLAPRDFPQPVANRVHTLKMAEAFSRHCEFVLAVSALHCTVDELWEQYGITHPFEIDVIGEPRLKPKTLFGMPGMLRIISRHKPDFLYMREEHPAWILSFLRRNLVYEMHDYMSDRIWIYSGLIRRSRMTVAISNGLIDTVVAKGLPRDKFHLAPAGVDLAVSEQGEDVATGKEKVGLPVGQKIVLYIGRLSDWKGVDVLVKCTRFLPEGVRVVVVGGFPGEPEALRNLAAAEGMEGRVDVLGHVSFSKVSDYLEAADVVVLPNKPINKLSTSHTSPLKLREYMASRRPIVASDLPSTREIVDDASAILVTAGDPEDLARGIVLALEGGTAVADRVEKAHRLAATFTWEERAKQILEKLRAP